jgi:hypothetical protein
MLMKEMRMLKISQALALCMLMSAAFINASAIAASQQFGNMRANVPQGWKATQTDGGGLLMPPGLTKEQAVIVGITPSQTLRDFETQFDRQTKVFLSEYSIVKQGDVVRGRSPHGYDVLRREIVLRGATGNTLYMLMTAANPNGRFESLTYTANSSALYRQYFQHVNGMVDSIRFVAPATNASAAQEIKGPSKSSPVYVDAPSRKAGEENLKPLPAGSTRLNGLYARPDSGGTLNATNSWRFYYFLPNGYTYMGAKEAGLENIQCMKATVDKYGSPQCSTYSADNGQIRIGNLNATRFRRKGDDLQIGDYTYELIPKAANLRMDGTYSSFSAGASAASSSEISFSRDGRFRSSNFIGVAVDTGDQSGGDRVSVAGNSTRKAEGTYRINGYTLELNYGDGRKARAFFARVAGDEVVRIGSRSYTRD